MKAKYVGATSRPFQHLDLQKNGPNPKIQRYMGHYFRYCGGPDTTVALFEPGMARLSLQTCRWKPARVNLQAALGMSSGLLLELKVNYHSP